MRLISIKNFALSLLLLAAAVTITNAQTYSGQAVAATATVAVVGQPVVKAGLSDTGELSYTGGNVNLVGAGTTLAGIATVGAATVNTTGAGGTSSSSASVASTSINVLGNTIAAGVIQAATQSLCPGSVVSGSSSVATLQINGLGVTVLGTPNQSVSIFADSGGTPVLVGQLILNEEIVGVRGITRNAMRLSVTALDGLTKIDVVVASARSRIDCGQVSTTNIFGGRGTTVQLNQQVILGPVFLSSYVADSGRLPWTGGNTSVSTAGANVAGLVSTGTVTSTTNGGVAAGTPNATASSADVENLGVNVLGGLGVTLNATALESDTNCSCSAQVASCSSSSNTANIAVTALGLPITIPVNPGTNFSINLLGIAVLHLNEERAAGSGNFRAITRNALRLDLNLLVAGTDLAVASSHSSIVCGLAPTAGEVTLSGRVVDTSGRGLSRAVVSITDGMGLTKNAVTNTFGNYSFRDLPAGRTYFASVSGGRQFTFESRTVSLEDSVSGFDFAPTISDFNKKNK